MSHEHNDHVNETAPEETKNTNLFLRIFIIIVILIVLFFISIGIVRFIPKVLSSLAAVNVTSIFKSNPKLSVSLDKKEVADGESFLVSWKNNTEDKSGSYTFGFKCIEGLKISYLSERGERPVVCESTFPLPPEASQYSFKVTSSLGETTALPLNISLWDDNTETLKLSESVVLSVLKGNTVAKVQNNETTPQTEEEIDRGDLPTKKPTKSSTIDLTTDNKNDVDTNYFPEKSAPDIEVRLVKVGIIDAKNNFTETRVISPQDKVRVTFVVSNEGNAPTGAWKLKTTLPTTVVSDKNYISKIQPSLKPGDAFEMNLAFDSFDPSAKDIIIEAQSSTDTNTINNKIETTLEGDGSITSGKTDLEIAIVSIGVMDRETNRFSTSNNFYSDDKIAMKFEVTNKGGKASGPWSFKALFPSNGEDNLDSGSQPSLKPGAKMTFTLGFDSPKSGSQKVSITVDDNNRISEDNESNNYVEKSIYINP